MGFEVKMEPLAINDVNEAIHWYNSQKTGLGEKFYNLLEASIENLKVNPYHQIRYEENIRCLPLKKYPYMIHFNIDETEKLIKIIAILHTSRKPISVQSKN